MELDMNIPNVTEHLDQQADKIKQVAELSRDIKASVE